MECNFQYTGFMKEISFAHIPDFKNVDFLCI